MASCDIDHLTVTALSLEAGVDFIEHTLGVVPAAGGEHPRMGTHNRLLRLGASLFLEIIAPNPQAQAPARPRWFNLDRMPPSAAPALTTWVVRTQDIETTARDGSEPLGVVEPMSRGAFNWRMTLPADGSVPLDGVGPALIQWEGADHPAARLPDMGLSLERFEIMHPQPERVRQLLASIGVEGPITVRTPQTSSAACLVAYIRTPQGLRRLCH